MPFPTFRTRTHLVPLLIGLAALAGPAGAQSQAPATPAETSALPAWDRLTPAQRERLITPEQRAALKAQWRGMTPEQRRDWVDANPPPAERPKTR